MTVAELFERVLPRLKSIPPGMDFVDAAYAVQDVVTRRLWEKKSDLLRDPWQSAAQAIGTSLVDLPVDMLGPCDENPYLTYTSGSSTQVAALRPLSVPRSTYATATAATPREYDRRGSICELFPASSIVFTLHMPMYRRPAPLTDMGDELPWQGFYDQLFQDAVLALATPGGAFSYVGAHMEEAIRRTVDTGASLRTGRKVQWLWA